MTTESYDYVIVGAGAAGCVLAYRLSEDPSVKVALIEAGGSDAHPAYRVPKGVALVMSRAQAVWPYPVEPEASTANKVEYWVRGKVLGGSTSVNGLMYVRGQPADFDAMAAQTSEDWNWQQIGAAYQALEQHELGAGEGRGTAGPLRVGLPGADVRNGLHAALLAAGQALGLPVKQDINTPDNGEGIGYNARTVYRGRRQSAVTAFLAPARARPNLRVITDALVDTIEFDGSRASGVRYLQDGSTHSVRAHGEVIVAAGALASPGILERSGIGDPARLQALGIPLRHASPGVGEHLLEHRALLMQWRLKRGAPSLNAAHKGWRLALNALRYQFLRSGPLTSATFDLGVWLKSRPELERPDLQFLIAPHSVDYAKLGKTTEDLPGMSMVIYPLRPSSKGSVHIAATDASALPKIAPNHRDTSEDRGLLVACLRAARKLMAQAPIAAMIENETLPGPQVQSDEDILGAFDTFATCGYHAVGSCRMGSDAASVVDPQTRVRGVDGLRVVDTSIFPVMPSGNTQGPTMALAWRAADVIRATRRAR